MAIDDASEETKPPEVIMEEPLPSGITTHALDNLYKTGRVTVEADASGRLLGKPNGYFHTRINWLDKLFHRAKPNPPSETK